MAQWYADADDLLWQTMIHMPKGSAYDGYFERVWPTDRRQS